MSGLRRLIVAVLCLVPVLAACGLGPARQPTGTARSVPPSPPTNTAGAPASQASAAPSSSTPSPTATSSRAQLQRTQLQRTQLQRTQLQRTQLQRAAGGAVDRQPARAPAPAAACPRLRRQAP